MGIIDRIKGNPFEKLKKDDLTAERIRLEREEKLKIAEVEKKKSKGGTDDAKCSDRGVGHPIVVARSPRVRHRLLRPGGRLLQYPKKPKRPDDRSAERDP